MKEKTTRDWIDYEIKKLNEFRQVYLGEVHKLEGVFEYFSYSKDMTGYKLTSNNYGTSIGKRMNGKEFLSFLETINDVLKAMDRHD